MPGSSLWLCPPHSSPLYSILSTLIRSTIPSHFPSVRNPPVFPPHITITSDTISPDIPGSPSDWLRNLLEPILPAASDLCANFCGLDTEDTFFRRLTIRIEKDGGGAELARQCRERVVLGTDAAGAEKWANEEYRPHLSLLYADTNVTPEKLDEVRGLLTREGISLEKEADGYGGFKGGKILLVPTYKPVHEWEPIAEIDLT